MSDAEKKKAAAGGNSERQKNSGSPSRCVGNDGKWWENTEYVIDEYWDEKFGFSFGIIDWRSLGIGC